MYFSLFQKIVSKARTSLLKMVQNTKIGILVPHAVSISRSMVGPNLVMFAVLSTSGTYPKVYFSLFQKIVSKARTSPLKMAQNAKIGILVLHAVSISRSMVGPNLVMFAVL